MGEIEIPNFSNFSNSIYAKQFEDHFEKMAFKSVDLKSVHPIVYDANKVEEIKTISDSDGTEYLVIKNPDFHFQNRLYKPKYMFVKVDEVKSKSKLKRTKVSVRWTLMKDPVATELDLKLSFLKKKGKDTLKDKTPVHGIYKNTIGKWALLANKGAHYDCIIGDNKREELKGHYESISQRLMEVYLKGNSELELWKQVILPSGKDNFEDQSIIIKKETYSFKVPMDK